MNRMTISVLQLCAKRRLLSLSKYVLAAVIIILLIHTILSSFPTNTFSYQCTNCTVTKPMKLIDTHQKSFSNITIAITICGNASLIQGLNALKSALMLSKYHLHLIAMADSFIFDILKRQFHELHESISTNFTYELHPVVYPSKNMSVEWRKLFKECASFRLFLPAILKNHDSVLYIDTDVLFISPVEQMWEHFSLMNSNQIAAMSYESEDFSNSWYHRFAKHPYYGRYGLNSGVMLMNLTRMRQFDWIAKLEPTLIKYRSKIVWGDQDIINIIFHSNEEKLFLFGCNWNYRPDHCIYSSVCKPAETDGIKIIHGNRGVFLNEKQPIFKAMFNVFRRYKPNDHKRSLLDLVVDAKNALLTISKTSGCGRISNIIWKSFSNLTNDSFD